MALTRVEPADHRSIDAQLVQSIPQVARAAAHRRQAIDQQANPQQQAIDDAPPPPPPGPPPMTATEQANPQQQAIDDAPPPPPPGPPPMTATEQATTTIDLLRRNAELSEETVAILRGTRDDIQTMNAHLGALAATMDAAANNAALRGTARPRAQGASGLDWPKCFWTHPHQ